MSVMRSPLEPDYGSGRHSNEHGKAVNFMSAWKDGTLFAGRRIVQHRDYRVTLAVDVCVKAKFRPIEVPKGYLSNTKEVSEGMLTNIKGVNGLVGWHQREDQTWQQLTRSFHLGVTEKSPQFIFEVNAAVK